MKAALVSVAVVTAVVAVGAVPQRRNAPPPPGDTPDVVLFAKNTMVPMRDGVKLATDIYRPAVNGVPIADKLPILLQRTPYNKEGAALVAQARAFAAHGYVVVLQDERGAYHSEGVQSKYVGYGEDGFDTIEWLAKLPYTDGQVGMWGTSYAAHVQAGAAILHPPHLKTIVLNCGGLYNGWLYKVRNHGAFELVQPSADYPAGYEMNVTDGVIRGRYRNSLEHAELMKPGEIYELTIEPFPTANIFKKGHRIRVDISSSNFPRFDVNPNTGEPLGQHKRMQKADNNVFHDAAHPSAIVLPIVPHVATSAPTPTYQDKFVTVNGLKIHYLDWGGNDKPPLVLIHGIARHAHTFDHLVPELSRNYHVIAYDMRGHGDSGWSAEGAYLVEDHVKDLEGLVQQLRLKNITLFGNSTGGRVVQVFAGLHPDLVSRIVVEDVGPERPQEIASGFARRVQEEANGWPSEEELVAQLVKQNPRTPESQLKTYAKFGVRKQDDGRVVWKRDPNLVKGFVATELWQYVSRITAPTIYVLGGASTIVAPEAQERLKKTLPRVEIVTMPGLGHYPSSEDPEGFLRIVRSFLDRSAKAFTLRPPEGFARLKPRATTTMDSRSANPSRDDDNAFPLG
jgi:pimeloyl-ACP methyl ester carboxylesterase